MNAEKNQVAGDHYKNMDYQPARFGFDVGLVSLGTSIAKYLTRDKGSRIENLEKAYHCLCLEQQFGIEEDYLDYFDIYISDHHTTVGFNSDEEYLSKFFGQFKDGNKLKAVMRKYMQGNFPQAKGLLRKYINGLKNPSKPKCKFKVGDTVYSIISDKTLKVVEVEHCPYNVFMVWLSSGKWSHEEDLQLV